MKKSLFTLLVLAGTLLLSGAESPNLLTKTNFISKGKKVDSSTLELVLGRVRKDYKPPIADGGVNTALKLAPGKYAVSFLYKGEKVNTVTVWFQLKMKSATKYPAKNFKAAKEYTKACLEFDVPEEAQTVFAVMFKTALENKGTLAYMKDLKLMKIPVSAKK